MQCWGCNSPGVSAASQQTLFIVSGSPSNPILGEVTKCYVGVIIVLGISAASQQTLFIVSGSPSNPILGEVTKCYAGVIIVLGISAASA